MKATFLIALSLLLFALVGGWAVMMLFGLLHVIWVAVPAVGFLTAAALVLVLRVVVGVLR